MAYTPLSTVSSVQQIINAVNAVLRGRSNATGTVTLAASVTTTTITDTRISNDSQIVLSPRTSSACAVSVSTYISSVSDGQAVITHTSLTSTDRTFGYVICG